MLSLGWRFSKKGAYIRNSTLYKCVIYESYFPMFLPCNHHSHFYNDPYSFAFFWTDFYWTDVEKTAIYPWKIPINVLVHYQASMYIWECIPPKPKDVKPKLGHHYRNNHWLMSQLYLLHEFYCCLQSGKHRFRGNCKGENFCWEHS